MKRTEIIVDQAGNMKVDQQGFSGKACAEMTDKLMAGIKSKVKAEVKKPEFHNRADAKASGATQRW